MTRQVKVLTRACEKRLLQKDIEIYIKESHCRESCRRESFMLDRLNHPNIVKSYGISNSGRHLYLENGQMDLYSRIENSPGYRLPCDEVMEIGSCIADALAYMHSSGVSHNDVKPENIVLFKQKDKLIPKLIDFESVTFLNDPPTGIYTEAYCSPERLQHPLDYNKQASDVWSFGATLHVARFGAFPNADLNEDGFSKELKPQLKRLFEYTLHLDIHNRMKMADLHSLLSDVH